MHGFLVFTTFTFLLLIYVYDFKMTSRLLSVEYEVFGRVQGVFFRKFTKTQANNLGLKGWVRNDSSGTVIGVIQGQEQAVQQMKKWLCEVGSPYSKITSCQFKNEREINECEFDSFKVTS